MCLLAIAIEQHPDYPVIIAANRDEFYSRPTAPLDYWEDQPNILAGRDLQGMGTWLGVAKTGRIGAITNYRDPKALNRQNKGPSRGNLIREFLEGADPPETYIGRIRSHKNIYNGFNLIVGELDELWWYSNVTDDSRKLSPGIHGISNHLLNTPWPKVEKINAALNSILKKNSYIEPELIFEKLADRKRPPDHDLPDTGVGLEWERILSPIFITSNIYGTRASSIIFIDRSWHVSFYERTFSLEDNSIRAGNTRRFDFKTAKTR